MKKTRVKSSCIKDRGAPGKGPKLIPPLKKGKLSKYGYSDLKNKTNAERHTALKKAVKATSAEDTMHRVTALMVLNKSRPALHKKLQNDVDWIHDTYFE